MTSHLRQGTKIASAIARLLVVVVLFSALMPMHYHLHHDRGSAGADRGGDHHLVDLHPVLDATDVDHHQDAHTIDALSDATIKALSPLAALVVLFLSLVLLLPVPARMTCVRFARESFRLPRLCWHNTPPLRAPPRA